MIVVCLFVCLFVCFVGFVLLNCFSGINPVVVVVVVVVVVHLELLFGGFNRFHKNRNGQGRGQEATGAPRRGQIKQQAKSREREREREKERCA